MNAKVFDVVLKARLARTESLLGAKADEYATDADRLHNFKRAAEVQRITAAQACLNYFMKHFISVQDMVERKAEWSLAWEEKLGDMIAYLILLEAILQEPALDE